MIYLNIQGGLGNQLFQSAFGLVLQEMTGQEISFLTQSFTNYTYGFKFELADNFPSLREYFSPDNLPAEGSIVLCEPDQYESAQDVLNQICAYARSNPNILLDGYWADERYFQNHEGLIRKHFNPSHSNPELEKVGTELKQQGVIGVHVRRAEYGHHGVAKMDYYRNCIKEIRRQFGELPILVFTDEYNVCTFEFSKIPNLQVIKGDPKNPYNDFYLLSKCKHFVLSNSSFSYWAAFLGEQPDSMIYMPYPFCTFKPVEFLKHRATKWHIVDGAVVSA